MYKKKVQELSTRQINLKLSRLSACGTEGGSYCQSVGLTNNLECYLILIIIIMYFKLKHIIQIEK